MEPDGPALQDAVDHLVELGLDDADELRRPLSPEQLQALAAELSGDPADNQFRAPAPPDCSLVTITSSSPWYWGEPTGFMFYIASAQAIEAARASADPTCINGFAVLVLCVTLETRPNQWRATGSGYYFCHSQYQ